MTLGGAGLPYPQDPDKEEGVRPIRLTIQDIASAAGVEAVEHALRTVPGVMTVRADLAGNDVLVEAAETVQPDALIAAVEEAGFVAVLSG